MTLKPHDPNNTRARPLAVGQVLIVTVVALLGGALLNAQGILRTAEQQELGTGRNIAIALADPLGSVSSFLRFDLPRQALDNALGRNPTRRDVPIAAPTSTTTTTSTQEPTPPTTATEGPARPTTTTGIPVAPTTTTGIPVAPTTTTQPAQRLVTAEEPLDLWIIGDSFVELFGPALVNRSADTGVIDAIADFRYISGLSRPEFFDWPLYIAEEMPNVGPDAAVVVFGGNDAVDVAIGEERFDVGTAAWVDLYATRVDEAMDVLLTGVDRIYWIGLPIMKSDSFTAKVQMMNAVYKAEAEKRPRATYISSFDLFKDENGAYNAFLDGEQVRFRDGAHFVWNGAYRLADAVLPVIATDWNIDLGR